MSRTRWRILNRLTTWCRARGVSYEADPRHVERIVQDTGVGPKKDLSSPGVKVYSHDNKDDHPLASKMSKTKLMIALEDDGLEYGLESDSDGNDEVDYNKGVEPEHERGRDLMQRTPQGLLKTSVAARAKLLDAEQSHAY